MGTIRELENKDGIITYSVSIRKKGQSICATFSDLATAKLYIKMKESIIDEMEAFEVNEIDLIRLKDAFNVKIEESIKDQLSKKSIGDIKQSYSIFVSIIGEDFYLKDINFEKLKEITDFLMKRMVAHGGNRTDPRNLKSSSFSTVRRNLAILSSVYGCLIKKGIDIKNPLSEFMPYFLNMNKKDVL